MCLIAIGESVNRIENLNERRVRYWGLQILHYRGQTDEVRRAFEYLNIKKQIKSWQDFRVNQTTPKKECFGALPGSNYWTKTANLFN